MRILLDTHIFLWIAQDTPRKNARIREAIGSATEVFVSAATVWEIAIKSSLGKLRVDSQDVLEELRTGGFRELPVLACHSAAVANLPFHHKDPFDRMLVAQAMVESMQLLTADPHLAAYSELVVTI